MKQIIILICFVVLGCKSQQKETVKTTETTTVKTIDDSNCIATRIDAFRKKTQCKTGSMVKTYLFQKKLVYVFYEGPCGADMQAPVYDKNCRKLGDLGGFLGNTKINGVSFSEAIFQEVIWKQKPE